MGISFFLVFNRQGKPRLAKWYIPFNDDEKKKLLIDVFRTVTSRNEKFTNWVEFRNGKLVYKRYAGLYFVLMVDPQDNELAALESIHLFVEILDLYFQSVCELDLVFNFWKVYAVLDEVFLAGEIMETSKRVVLERMDKIDHLD
jgi:AP-2 complex subunit sigma-1